MENNEQPMADYYTTAEAAKEAKLSQARIIQLIGQGALEAVKAGRQWFLPKSQFAEGAPFWSRTTGRPRKDAE